MSDGVSAAMQKVRYAQLQGRFSIPIRDPFTCSATILIPLMLTFFYFVCLHFALVPHFVGFPIRVNFPLMCLVGFAPYATFGSGSSLPLVVPTLLFLDLMCLKDRLLPYLRELVRRDHNFSGGST